MVGKEIIRKKYFVKRKKKYFETKKKFFVPLINFLKKRKLNGRYSSFKIAGSAIGITAGKFKKWHKSFWDNIHISIKLHKIKKLIVVKEKELSRLVLAILNLWHRYYLHTQFKYFFKKIAKIN